MPSDYFTQVVNAEATKQGKADNLPLRKGKATFSLITGDRREKPSEHTISELTFTVTEGALRGKVAVSAMETIARYLDVEEIGAVDNILASFGFGKVPKTTRRAGSTTVVYTEDEDVVGAKYRSGRKDIGIQTTSGKYISSTSLRSLLQILTIKYILDDMTDPNAPLKYRTGRFANNVRIKNPSLSSKASQVSLFYTYMLRPYAVFDPRYGNAKASHGRNPQRIIGEALEKAARDLIHARYNVVIRQANQAFPKDNL